MAFHSIDFDYEIDYNYEELIDFQTIERFIVPAIFPKFVNNEMDSDSDNYKGFDSVNISNDNSNSYYIDNNRKRLKRCFSPYEHYWLDISKPNIPYNVLLIWRMN